MTTNQPGDTNSALKTIIDRSDWRQNLVSDYTDTAQRLLDAYNRTRPRLEQAAGAFTQRVNEWVTLNPDANLTAEYVRGFKQFQDLLARVAVETRDFAALLRNEAGGLQDRAVLIGSDGALEMTQKTSGGFGAEIAAAWNRVAPEALVALIGYVDGEAFRDRAALFGDNAAENISDVILTSVAQGKNPRALAGILTSWFSVPYAWADNMARTVQLYSYRMANHASYSANADVLDGWVWSATLDSRVCLSCVSQHGTVHKLTETLNDHHRGRCLTPGQLVKTINGYIPIEKVAIGDYVLTHKGRYRRVLNTFSREYSGDVRQLTAGGFTVITTPEHPILTQRGWVEAQFLNADDTLETLYKCDVLESNLNTVQPPDCKKEVFLASIGRFLGELCQRGSYSTASLKSGNAKSILNVSTANCGTGCKPCDRKTSRNSSSIGLQKVSQLASRFRARVYAAFGDVPAATRRANNSGSFDNWRRKASLGVIGSIPFSLINFIRVRVFIPISDVISRYVAFSSMYRLESHNAIGSPILASNAEFHLIDCNFPTSRGVRGGNPSAFLRCNTAFTVLPGSLSEMPLTDIELSKDKITASSSGVQGVPFTKSSPDFIGTSIHQLQYSGKVYDIEVEEDHSFYANGIVVHNCAPVPLVKGTRWIDTMQTGPDWFEGLDEGIQQQMMGAAMWNAWNDGAVQWSEMSQPYQDPIYGEMLREASVKGVLGADAQRYYVYGQPG